MNTQVAEQLARELSFAIAAYPHSPELSTAVLFPDRVLGFNWVGVAYEWGQFSLSVASTHELYRNLFLGIGVGGGWQESLSSPVVLVSVTLHFTLSPQWFVEVGGGPLWFTEKPENSLFPAGSRRVRT